MINPSVIITNIKVKSTGNTTERTRLHACISNEIQAISVIRIRIAEEKRTLLSKNEPVISGSVTKPVFLTFLAKNKPRMISPRPPARSYHRAGNPWA